MKHHASLIIAAALGVLSAGCSREVSQSAPAAANKAIYQFLGEPVAPPANMDAAYTKEGLIHAMQTAAEGAGITLKKVQIDDSEFPFLVGVICANQQDMEKLKEQIRKIPAYSFTGGVGGNGSYAMNLVPHTAWPADAGQRIGDRLSVREMMLFDKMHENR